MTRTRSGMKKTSTMMSSDMRNQNRHIFPAGMCAIGTAGRGVGVNHSSLVRLFPVSQYLLEFPSTCSSVSQLFGALTHGCQPRVMCLSLSIHTAHSVLCPCLGSCAEACWYACERRHGHGHGPRVAPADIRHVVYHAPASLGHQVARAGHRLCDLSPSGHTKRAVLDTRRAHTAHKRRGEHPCVSAPNT